jgi:hypothetical protein
MHSLLFCSGYKLKTLANYPLHLCLSHLCLSHLCGWEQEAAIDIMETEHVEPESDIFTKVWIVILFKALGNENMREVWTFKTRALKIHGLVLELVNGDVRTLSNCQPTVEKHT